LHEDAKKKRVIVTMSQSLAKRGRRKLKFRGGGKAGRDLSVGRRDAVLENELISQRVP